jgi:hypothetical protein
MQAYLDGKTIQCINMQEVWFTKGRFDMHNTNWEN